jgi:hypothetical protein
VNRGGTLSYLRKRVGVVVMAGAASIVAYGCGGSSSTTLVRPSSDRCAISIPSTPPPLSASGGTGSLAVSSDRECVWTVTSEAAWLSVTSESSGQGNGTVTYAAGSNPVPTMRRGMLQVGSARAEIQQAAAPCQFTVTPAALSFEDIGGEGTINVETLEGCGWTATSGESWIVVTAVQNASGSGTVRLRVERNAGEVRTAGLTVAGQAVAISQGAAPTACGFSLDPAARSVAAAGGASSIAVRAQNGCVWTGVSQVPWITITGGASGTGNGTVTLSVAPNTGPQRAGTVIVAGQIHTVTQASDAAPCAYAIAPSSFAAAAAGGTTTVAVTAQSGCGWTAATLAQWITVTSGATGSGNGTVNLTIAANTGAARSGTLTIAGHTFTVTQVAPPAPCSYGISPTEQTAPATGGTSAVTVTAGNGCGWTASSQALWIAVTSGESGSGNGTVNLSIAANAGAERVGTATIAGKVYTVRQAAAPAPCSFSIAPTEQAMPATGGPATVAVTTANGCAWDAASQALWITVASGATGIGNGPVNLTIAANTGPARVGTVAIAGLTYTVTQAAVPAPCSYTIAPTEQAVPAQGATSVVAVTTQSGCAWTAVRQVDWITVTSGASGAGSGPVELTIAANAGASRVGTVIIAGQTFTVTQAAAAPVCSATLTPEAQAVPNTGGEFTVLVSTQPGCAWTIASTVDWIEIPGNRNRNGTETVRYKVAANSGLAARTGTIEALGQVLTVTQAGAPE